MKYKTGDYIEKEKCIYTILENLGNSLLKVNCSICSSDPDMWGEYINTPTNTYKTFTKYSCGCSTIPKFTEDQQKLRIERYCHDNYLKFLGWEGIYKGNKTRLRITDTINLISTNSATIATMVQGFYTNPILSREKKQTLTRNEDAVMMRRFLATGNFTENMSFSRADIGKDNMWRVDCTVCSTDIIALKGACEGYFYSHVTNLVAGKVPCRCSASPKYKKSWVEVLLRDKNSYNFRFIGWEGVYIDKVKSVVRYYCRSCRQVHTKNSWRTITEGYSCKSELMKLPTSFYTTLWELDGKLFYKYGITRPELMAKRVSSQNRKTSAKFLKVVEKFTVENRYQGLYLESLVRRKFGRSYMGRVDFRDGYTETLPANVETFTYIMTLRYLTSVKVVNKDRSDD